MPDPLELPRPQRPVVPQMIAGRTFVGEVVADRLPGPAAVVRTLDDLPEPSRGLRGVQPARVSRRPGHVVHLPAAEMRTLDLPGPALTIRRQDEGTLARTHQHSYSTHALLLSRQSPAHDR